MSNKPLKTEEEWLPVAQAQEAQRADNVLAKLYGDETENDSAISESHVAVADWTLPSALTQKPGVIGKLRFRLALSMQPVVYGVTHALIKERQGGTFFLWLPVFFGLGCLLYFSLPREPLVLAFPLLSLICFGLMVRLKARRVLRGFVVALCLVALGVSATQWRTNRLATTMLHKAIVADISGVVTKVERRADGRVRYTIIPDAGADDRNSLPVGFTSLVRATARKGGPVIRTGERISGKARLSAPSGPAYPGGYSFAFKSWFDGIGASGFFLGAPTRLAGMPESDWPTINVMRENIVAIIREALPGQSGALASALIVGDRSGIDEATAEALRLSGLAHILAISGLHMALLSATVIALIRLGGAGFPSLVLTRPVKKWAAGAALLAATIYLFLSGGSVATQRAWIMVAIMLIAILLDQRALTMRNVAIAAMIVLALTPEAILMPGFQMSFSAVAALVASYGALSKRRLRMQRSGKSVRQGFVKRLVIRDIGGLALTSIVAGLATGLFAAYHFHRIATLGLLANLAAMPLVSIVVMPLALVSVLFMPFGLEKYPLAVMAQGVEGVVGVAKWVAQNGPQGATGRLHDMTLVLATLGLLCLCLLKTRLRFAGIAFLAGSLVAIPSVERPDVLILENGRQVGVFGPKGILTLSRPRAEKFSAGIWHRAYPSSLLKIASEFVCDSNGCSIEMQGKVITHIIVRDGVTDDCYLADVLVVAFDADGLCENVDSVQRPMVIDRKALQRHGAHSLVFDSFVFDRGRSLNRSTQSAANIQSDALSNPSLQIRVERTFEGRTRPWTRHRESVSQKSRVATH